MAIRSGADVVLYAPPSELLPRKSARRNPARKSRLEEPSFSIAGNASRLLVRTALIRSNTWDPAKVPVITSSRAVYELLKHIAPLDQEYIVVVAVDSRARAVAVHETAVGGLSSAQQQLSNVVKVPFLVGVDRAIIAHNHPSGDARPSESDDHFTRAAVAAFKCLEMTLFDHVIVSTRGYFSYLDAGRL